MRKQLEKYDIEFLQKIKINLLYPKDFTEDPIVTIEEFLRYLGVITGVLFPIGLYFHYGDGLQDISTKCN